MVKLPGLIDPHVHIREPGGTNKEDWESGTKAAVAGGFTTILAMPNTRPPITDQATLWQSLEQAKTKAVCDYAQFLGAGPDNLEMLDQLAPQTAGLKLYLDQTFGPLRLDDMSLWMDHFNSWPKNRPIVAHSEGRTMAAIILMAALHDRPVHIAHVSLRDEILLIRKAKEKGIKVTCEVAPHHLFLSTDDIASIGANRSEVRPRLARPEDQEALWQNLDVIDIFATDHAPHTISEKEGANPPPGFPGLETALPLFITAVQEGRLSLDDLRNKMVINPMKIFSIPEQPETWIEVDTDVKWHIQATETFTRCGWTPFEGRRVSGRVNRVFIRDTLVYSDHKFLVKPGFGRNYCNYQAVK